MRKVNKVRIGNIGYKIFLTHSGFKIISGKINVRSEKYYKSDKSFQYLTIDELDFVYYDTTIYNSFDSARKALNTMDIYKSMRDISRFVKSKSI